MVAGHRYREGGKKKGRNFRRSIPSIRKSELVLLPIMPTTKRERKKTDRSDMSCAWPI